MYASTHQTQICRALLILSSWHLSDDTPQVCICLFTTSRSVQTALLYIAKRINKNWRSFHKCQELLHKFTKSNMFRKKEQITYMDIIVMMYDHSNSAPLFQTIIIRLRAKPRPSSEHMSQSDGYKNCTSIPDCVFVPTWWACTCSLISSFKDVTATLKKLARTKLPSFAWLFFGLARPRARSRPGGRAKHTCHLND